ncbi:hypothetical protein D3C81_2077430 [compost metagenome]
MHILPAGAFKVQHGVMHDLAALGIVWLGPVGADRFPGIAQAFEVGVAILRNQAGDPFRMG